MGKMALVCEVLKQPANSQQQQENGNVWEKWRWELFEADIPILPELVTCCDEIFVKQSQKVKTLQVEATCNLLHL